MKRKLVAAAIAGFFSFILVTTAWDYCHPDPDTLLFKGDSVSQDQQIKKLHHPCASLKDAFESLRSFRISQPSISQISDHLISKPVRFSLADDSFTQSGLSPPPESPPQTLPLFQLNCNLRI